MHARGRARVTETGASSSVTRIGWRALGHEPHAVALAQRHRMPTAPSSRRAS